MNLAIFVRVLDVVYFYLSLLFGAIPYRVVIGAAGPLMIGAYLALRAGNPDFGQKIDILRALGVAVGLVAIAAMFLIFYVMMILANLSQNQPTGDVRIALDSVKISISSDRGVEIFPWSRVTDVGQSDSFLWVHVDDRHYRFIPRRSLPDDPTYRAAWSLIASYYHAA